MGYTEQRTWADSYNPEIKKRFQLEILPLFSNLDFIKSKPEVIQQFILKQNLSQSFEVSSFHQDTKECTDFCFTLKIQNTLFKIACRLRNPYKDRRDLTIRSYCHGGVTEIDKIGINDYGNWYFYGYIVNNTLTEYYLINLDYLREKGALDRNYLLSRFPEIPNKDGSRFIAPEFVWFDEHFPQSVILHKKG